MTHAETYGVTEALIIAHLGGPDARMSDLVPPVLGRLQDHLPEHPWFETLCEVYPTAKRWRDDWVRFYGYASPSASRSFADRGGGEPHRPNPNIDGNGDISVLSAEERLG